MFNRVVSILVIAVVLGMGTCAEVVPIDLGSIMVNTPMYTADGIDNLVSNVVAGIESDNITDGTNTIDAAGGVYVKRGVGDDWTLVSGNYNTPPPLWITKDDKEKDVEKTGWYGYGLDVGYQFLSEDFYAMEITGIVEGREYDSDTGNMVYHVSTNTWRRTNTGFQLIGRLALTNDVQKAFQLSTNAANNMITSATNGLATTADLGGYLPLSGGTLTGDIYVGEMHGDARKIFVASDITSDGITLQGGNDGYGSRVTIGGSMGQGGTLKVQGGGNSGGIIEVTGSDASIKKDGKEVATEGYVDTQVSGVSNTITTLAGEVNSKADSASVYTKEEIDAKGYVTESITNGLATKYYVDEQVSNIVEAATNDLGIAVSRATSQMWIDTSTTPVTTNFNQNFVPLFNKGAGNPLTAHPGDGYYGDEDGDYRIYNTGYGILLKDYSKSSYPQKDTSPDKQYGAILGPESIIWVGASGMKYEFDVWSAADSGDYYVQKSGTALPWTDIIYGVNPLPFIEKPNIVDGKITNELRYVKTPVSSMAVYHGLRSQMLNGHRLYDENYNPVGGGTYNTTIVGTDIPQNTNENVVSVGTRLANILDDRIVVPSNSWRQVDGAFIMNPIHLNNMGNDVILWGNRNVGRYVLLYQNSVYHYLTQMPEESPPKYSVATFAGTVDSKEIDFGEYGKFRRTPLNENETIHSIYSDQLPVILDVYSTNIMESTLANVTRVYTEDGSTFLNATGVLTKISTASKKLIMSNAIDVVGYTVTFTNIPNAEIPAFQVENASGQYEMAVRLSFCLLAWSRAQSKWLGFPEDDSLSKIISMYGEDLSGAMSEFTSRNTTSPNTTEFEFGTTGGYWPAYIAVGSTETTIVNKVVFSKGDAKIDGSLSVGHESSNAANLYAFASGTNVSAVGIASHAEGVNSTTLDSHAYAFAWNGDITSHINSHGEGTFNINPVGGPDGFYIGEKKLSDVISGIVTNNISADNPTFANAVLDVSLNIDTNSVAVLNEIASTFGGFPLGVGETATTIGGLLAALAAAVAWLKKSKADKATTLAGYGITDAATMASIAPEYSPSSTYAVGSFVYHDGNIYQCKTETADVGEAWNAAHWELRKLDDFFTNSNSLLTATIDARLPYPINAVPSTGVLKDRTLNTTSLASVTVPDNFTDLLIRASVASSLSVTMPEAITTKYGDTFPGEAGEYLITITKTGASEAYVRTIKLEVANA